MKKYKFLLTHDNGKTTITTIADNLSDAKNKIMNAEMCPERALTLISTNKLEV